jgi:hypothetical protein
MLSRRSFFGAAAVAPIAASALAEVPRFPAGGIVGAASKLQTLTVGLDTSAISEQFEMIKGYSQSFENPPCRHPYRPPAAGPTDRYIYRTGFPAIDALRSISGVHKARMEKRYD